MQINAGHEVMIDRCWLGETNFDFDYTKFGSVPNASAIQINGNDHYVLNTIVFSSRIGLEIHGAAVRASVSSYRTSQATFLLLPSSPVNSQRKPQKRQKDLPSGSVRCAISLLSRPMFLWTLL